MNIIAIKEKLKAQFEEELFTNDFNLSHDKKMLAKLLDERQAFVDQVDSLEAQLKSYPADDKTKDTRDKKRAQVLELGKVRRTLTTYDDFKSKLESGIIMAERKSQILTDKISYLETYDPQPVIQA